MPAKPVRERGVARTVIPMRSIGMDRMGALARAPRARDDERRERRVRRGTTTPPTTPRAPIARGSRAQGLSAPVRPEGHPCDPSLWISWEIPAQVSFAGISQPGYTCIPVVSEGSFLGFGILEFKSHAVTPVVQPLWYRFLRLPRRESLKGLIRLFRAL